MPTATLSPERIGVHTIKPEVLSRIAPLPEATAFKLPRWRGFNLLNRFYLGWSNTPFLELDFELIGRWGFNFARLPVDYRVYIEGEDWLQIKPEVIEDFDRAIAYGAKYGVHINLCLHRIPGYTVAAEKEKASIFTDSTALEVACRHWAMFARRWAGIPNRLLSFNLFNEPNGADAKIYAAVVSALVNAIRKEDPDRLIIADALGFPSLPSPELVSLKVAQSLHNYEPVGLTHYKARWLPGADLYPVPQWPSVQIGGFIYAKHHKAMFSPLEIDIKALGPAGGSVGLHLTQVSSEAEFVIKADGKEIYRHHIVCSDGKGEWLRAVYTEQYKLWQNEFDRTYTARYPAGTRKLSIEMVKGDWLRFSELLITPDDHPPVVINASPQWGKHPGRLVINANGTARNLRMPYGGVQDRTWLSRTVLKPWVDFRKRYGMGIMIGEWGVFSATPHALALRYMEDSLRAFKQANMSWALWNLRGDFGIINSNRIDVQYEQMGSDKLDRKMLELLKRY